MASSELLKQIQAGRKLKHAETSDRSAPQIDSSPKDFGRSNGAPIQKAPLSSGGELGGLFAGGMPKLKPVGPSKLGTLGKPPSIPKANGSLAPTPPPRNVPKPPARPVPSERNDIVSSPPPPPRRPPPATHSSSPVRSAPAPPARKPPSAARNPAAHIDSTYPPESTVLDSSNVPRTSYLPPPSRRLPLASSNGDTSPAPRRKIPSPSPNAGEHTFPVTGFPLPRVFKNTSKFYKSGSQLGSPFDLGNL